MTHVPKIKIPAVYMRSGTSKGVFFRLQDLPEAARAPGAERDNFLLRVIGDATSGTGKTVILSRSARPCHDVDCVVGQVHAGEPFVDWNGDCGSLSAAAGAFAISSGIIHQERLPRNGMVTVRIWQANIGKTIVARVPVTNGRVGEAGDRGLDAARTQSAEVQLEFIDPAVEGGRSGGAVFPTGNPVDELEVPGVGKLSATLINAGTPTIVVNAADIGYTGTALQEAIDGDTKASALLEIIRAYGAVRMGLIAHVKEAARSKRAPELAIVAPSTDYVSSNGKRIAAGDIDLVVRTLSMGTLHHAIIDAVAVAIGSAAAICGTVVSLAAGGDKHKAVRIGCTSGTLCVVSDVRQIQGEWIVIKAMMRRSSDVLPDARVGVPGEAVQVDHDFSLAP